MTALKKILILGFLFLFTTFAHASENVFYILHSKSAAQLLKNNLILQHLKSQVDKINMIISQAYCVDAKGNVTGFVDAHLRKFVHENQIKLLALITNSGFDKDKAHQFLSNRTAQSRAIDAIVAACQQYRYTGVQFDFEGVSIQDKEALTQFYIHAAKALHENGFLVSFAVVPTTGDVPYKSEYLKRKYMNWSGVYDLKTLGKISDFVSIMAYDQHGQGTLPGPISGYKWLLTTIKYALRHIPSHKLSLGIPVYSGYWIMTDRPNSKVSIRMNQISYKEVEAIVKAYKLKLNWDSQDKVNYVFFNHNWLYDHLFVEDARAFKEKYALIKKYNLRGISVFSLGNEDPRIWKTLHPKATR